MKKNIVLTILLIFLLFISLETNAQIDKHLTIGISYNQIMAYLDQYISMSKSSDIDGQPRYNGQTSDNLAFLEIIGDKRDISQAGLMFGIPSDSPDIIVRNTGILIRFMKNVVPEWNGGTEWVTSALERISTTNKPERIIMGNKLIEVQLIKVYGIACVTVKHKNAI